MPWLTIPAAGQYGVISDITPAELPPNAWSSATNMRFRDGYAERFEGQTDLFTAPYVTPYYIAPYATTDERWWIHAGLSRVYADNATGRDEITPASAPTGDVDNRYTGGTLNGVFLLNNGVDKPWYWGGTGVLQTIGAWPSSLRATVIRPFRNYIVMLDTTESGTRYPHKVRWSCAAEPGTLPATFDISDATQDAGEIDLAETAGLMVDCLPLGNMNIIYKQDSTYGQSYSGLPYVFNFQRLPGDFGLLAPGCVVNTPAGHVVFTTSDVIVHSGQGPTSILTGKQRRTLFAALDKTFYARSFLVTNLRRNEVWICYPESGADTCTRALVWNWAENTFSERDLENVTYAASGPIPQSVDNARLLNTDDGVALNEDGGDLLLQTSGALTGISAEPRVVTCSDERIAVVDKDDTFDAAYLLNEDGGYLLNEDSTRLILQDGEVFDCLLERVDLLPDQDPTSIKTILGVVPRFDAEPGTEIEIQVGGRNDVEKDVEWRDAVTYTVGTSRKANVRATYRFPAIRFSNTTGRWRLKSYDLDLKRGGTR